MSAAGYPQVSQCREWAVGGMDWGEEGIGVVWLQRIGARRRKEVDPGNTSVQQDTITVASPLYSPWFCARKMTFQQKCSQSSFQRKIK